MNALVLRRRPLARRLGGGAVMVSLGLHGAGAALAMLVLPRALGTSRGDAPGAQPQAVEIAFTEPSLVRAPAGGMPAGAATLQPALLAPRARTPRRASPVEVRSLVQTPPAPSSAAPAQAPEPTSVSRAEPAAALAAQAEVAPPAPRRFSLAAGTVSSRGVSTAVGRGEGTPGGDVRGSHAAGGVGDGVPLPEQLVDVPARLLGTVPLVYPEEARRAEVELDLPLVLDVAADGHVQAATALAQPGYGFEEAALRAVRGYLFRPAARGGQRVAVRMRWVVEFRLR